MSTKSSLLDEQGNFEKDLHFLRLVKRRYR